MDKEELQDQKQEQEALKSAKEIAKKKSKDKVQKIVWNAVKAAVIPMLILLVKILAVVLLVCAVASLFSSILSGNDESSTTSTNEEFLIAGAVQQGELESSGDGYNRVFVSKSGKMYVNYKQRQDIVANNSYASHYFYQDSKDRETIQETGCGLTCAAIVISGYGYPSEQCNPKAIVDRATNGIGYYNNEEGRYLSLTTNLALYGIQSTLIEGVTKEQVASHLEKQQKPVIIYVTAPSSSYTGSQHYMVLLDIDTTTNQVYLSNPSAADGSARSGWSDFNTVMEGCTNAIFIIS